MSSVATGFASEAASATGPGETSACDGLRPGDALWLVSTRGLYCPDPAADEPPLEYWHYDGRWRRSTRDAFFNGEAAAATCVYVHGNRIDWPDAFTRGWRVYRALVDGAPDRRPLRLVIWSWPSTRIRGLLRDLRVKADRTDLEGYYLAEWLSEIEPDSPASLIGFSYGARIVTGAMHLLGGGELAGRTLHAEPPHRRFDAVLLAAALHNDWLSPGHYHGRAVAAADRILVLYNPCDPALKRYRFAFRCSRPAALGYTGPAWCGESGPYLQRTEQENVGSIVGRQHNLWAYLDSPSLIARIRAYTSSDTAGPSDGPTEGDSQ